MKCLFCEYELPDIKSISQRYFLMAKHSRSCPGRVFADNVEREMAQLFNDKLEQDEPNSMFAKKKEIK